MEYIIDGVNIWIWGKRLIYFRDECFRISLPALDLYSGKYNAFHHLYRLKIIKDTGVSHVEFYFIFNFQLETYEPRF